MYTPTYTYMCTYVCVVYRYYDVSKYVWLMRMKFLNPFTHEFVPFPCLVACMWT